MPMLSGARQRESSSGLGAVTKGMPLHVVLSHPIPTPPPSGTRAGRRAAIFRHVERGLPTTTPSPTSPSANTSCLTTRPCFRGE
eukprot:365582-Chlamydomonas_euryale.AAC.13